MGFAWYVNMAAMTSCQNPLFQKATRQFCSELLYLVFFPWYNLL